MHNTKTYTNLKIKTTQHSHANLPRRRNIPMCTTQNYLQTKKTKYSRGIRKNQNLAMRKIIDVHAKTTQCQRL